MDFDMDIDSDNSSIHSIDMASSAGTSFSEGSSNRSESPVGSVMSINSTMQFYREEYGRKINNYSDIYRLPADEEEMERLEKQHVMLAEIMGYKYVTGMADIMAHIPGQRRRTCLDLGCGAGSWVIDVAKDFPHCRALAVDLVPMEESKMPPNLRSEVDDVNFGLEHLFNGFDVAHTRLIAAGVRDYYLLISQLARIVRPGGLIDISEYDFQTYDEHGEVIPVIRHRHCPPYWAKWLALVREAVDNRGGDVRAATQLHSWVDGHAAFEDVVYTEHFLPVVPPPRTGPNAEAQLRIDEGMTENILSFVRGGRTLLMPLGYTDAFLTALEQNIAAEISERKILQFTRLQCVSARRRQS